jgi:2-amino-4-hydroxy-6-hydroxymethyldihydropteridine diphosphokinase
VSLLDETDGITVRTRSSVYETEPVGEVLDQRDFYNAVVRVETDLEPRDLLSACKAVEGELGREPSGIRHGPRPIDVDLLLMGDVASDEPDLVLPHPEMARRRFVLEPLLEIDPELSLPGGARLAAALSGLASAQRVHRATAL